MQYRPTIGLEIHAELATRTKMFCDSANDPDETRPNVNVCPVCMAHPGTLPVSNREAVRQVLRIGVAVGGTLADESEFDRKSYFYPDIPKGYQISQYDHPLVSGGSLAGVALTRVHLEEDTARSMHVEGKSLVDFNRAGIPLMELVTEPVIPDAETAGRFARELQLLLRTLGAGEANLEKGEMRIEANISVADDAEDLNISTFQNGNDSEVKSLNTSTFKSRPPTGGSLGTKVEVKNLNSFRSVERAIAFEIDRQIALLEKGESIVQETRGWDESRQVTFHQRYKEGSADYRYFPEPDLPSLSLSEIAEFSPETLRASLPELPWERRERYARLGLKSADGEFIIAHAARGIFFDAVAEELKEEIKTIALAANYFISDCAGEPGGMSAHAFAKLIRMCAAQELSSRGTKEVLLRLVEHGGDPEVIAKELGLMQVHDAEVLQGLVDAVLAREEKVVLQYKSGKQEALQYLVGKAMQESKGAGNPETLRKLIIQAVSSKQ